MRHIETCCDTFFCDALSHLHLETARNSSRQAKCYICQAPSNLHKQQEGHPFICADVISHAETIINPTCQLILFLWAYIFGQEFLLSEILSGIYFQRLKLKGVPTSSNLGWPSYILLGLFVFFSLSTSSWTLTFPWENFYAVPAQGKHKKLLHSVRVHQLFFGEDCILQQRLSPRALTFPPHLYL